MMMEKSYKLLLWKAYFDKGFSLTNYLKYIIAILGVGAVFKGFSLLWIVAVGVVYAVLCLILGRVWFYYKLVDTELEVYNKVNPFVREMREKFK